MLKIFVFLSWSFGIVLWELFTLGEYNYMFIMKILFAVFALCFSLFSMYIPII